MGTGQAAERTSIPCSRYRFDPPPSITFNIFSREIFVVQSYSIWQSRHVLLGCRFRTPLANAAGRDAQAEAWETTTSVPCLAKARAMTPSDAAPTAGNERNLVGDVHSYPLVCM